MKVNQTVSGEILDDLSASFCNYIQEINERTHPSRLGKFDEIHVSDITSSCLRRAVLSRYFRVRFDCESDFNMQDGIHWEDLFISFLKQYGTEFPAIKSSDVNHPFIVRIRFPKRVEHRIRSVGRIITFLDNVSLVARPDLYIEDTGVLFELKRHHFYKSEQEEIHRRLRVVFESFLPEDSRDYLKGTKPSKKSLIFDTWFRPFFGLRIYESIAYQVLLYAYILSEKLGKPINRLAIIQIFKDVPELFSFDKEIIQLFGKSKKDAEYNELQRKVIHTIRLLLERLIMLTGYMLRPDSEVLWAYECMRRSVRTFCESCPFLLEDVSERYSPCKTCKGKNLGKITCTGLLPLKLSHFTEREGLMYEVKYELAKKDGMLPDGYEDILELIQIVSGRKPIPKKSEHAIEEYRSRLTSYEIEEIWDKYKKYGQTSYEYGDIPAAKLIKQLRNILLLYDYRKAEKILSDNQIGLGTLPMANITGERIKWEV